MEPKIKDSPKTKDVLKQLQAELRQLQATVSALPGTNSDVPHHAEKPSKADWAVQYTVSSRVGDAGKTGPQSFSEAQLARVTDEAAAALGNAVSSPQKVALMRALLTAPEGESAASLGATAALSTGSLYHHLHDLAHAGLIGQSGRNRYVLTERGRRVLLVLLALALPSS